MLIKTKLISTALWSIHTGVDHTGQLLLSNTKQHTDPSTHGQYSQDRDRGKQEKRHTDILLLARRPAPLHSANASVVVLDCGGSAAAGVAFVVLFGAGFQVAGSVAGAVVC